MRTVFCDLTRRQLDELGLCPDAAVVREDLLAAHDCAGCFGCWMRTPGACVARDALGDLGSLLSHTDELVVVSKMTFGWLSPLAKRALERSLGYLHPRFAVTDGELHHRMRYDHTFDLRFVLYGPSTDAERATARRLAGRNALNFGARLAGVGFPGDASGIPAERDAPASAPCEPAASGVPALSRRVALVNASPRGERSTTAALLADLEEALGVYARVYGDGPAPEVVHVGCPRSGADGDALSDCDTVLLGYPLYVDAPPAGLVDLLERAAGLLAPGTRVYALANMGFYEPEQIEPSFALLGQFCRMAGARWMGGVAVGAGPMVAAAAHGPRMGWARRAVSEAVDRLIAAMRSGSAAGFDGVRQGVPRQAYRRAAEKCWRDLARANGVDLDARP